MRSVTRPPARNLKARLKSTFDGAGRGSGVVAAQVKIHQRGGAVETGCSDSYDVIY